jgi:hypothetical protein
MALGLLIDNRQSVSYYFLAIALGSRLSTQKLKSDIQSWSVFLLGNLRILGSAQAAVHLAPTPHGKGQSRLQKSRFQHVAG